LDEFIYALELHPCGRVLMGRTALDADAHCALDGADGPPCEHVHAEFTLHIAPLRDPCARRGTPERRSVGA
jgi:hypothetical protein